MNSSLPGQETPLQLAKAFFLLVDTTFQVTILNTWILRSQVHSIVPVHSSFDMQIVDTVRLADLYLKSPTDIYVVVGHHMVRYLHYARQSCLSSKAAVCLHLIVDYAVHNPRTCNSAHVLLITISWTMIASRMRVHARVAECSSSFLI